MRREVFGNIVIDGESIHHVSFIADHPRVQYRKHCTAQYFGRQCVSAFAFFESLRTCGSRAAHPRVNEPALVASIVVPRHSAATATWTEQLSKCFLMADLREF
jgi:hypothetical protein